MKLQNLDKIKEMTAKLGGVKQAVIDVTESYPKITAIMKRNNTYLNAIAVETRTFRVGKSIDFSEVFSLYLL